MATHLVATTSSKAQLDDPSAVRALCEHYNFGGLTWKITDDDYFRLYGYDRLEACLRSDIDESRPEPDADVIEFVRHLAPALAPKEVLDIQSAGFQKLRLPLYGRRVVVSPNRVRVWGCFAFPNSRHNPHIRDFEPAETAALEVNQ